MSFFQPIVVPAHVAPETVAAFQRWIREHPKDWNEIERKYELRPFLLALLNSGDEGMNAAIEFARIPGTMEWLSDWEMWPWQFLTHLPDLVLQDLFSRPGLMESVASFCTADAIWERISQWEDRPIKSALSSAGAFYALASSATNGVFICEKIEALGGKRSGWPSEDIEQSWVSFSD